jgi:hypothetical protein
LNTPVYALASFSPDGRPEPSTLLIRLAAWILPLAVVAIFFVLQVQILRMTNEWVVTALLCLSVMVEFSLMTIWETIRSRWSHE